jgi:hypothetical protein
MVTPAAGPEEGVNKSDCSCDWETGRSLSGEPRLNRWCKDKARDAPLVVAGWMHRDWDLDPGPRQRGTVGVGWRAVGWLPSVHNPPCPARAYVSLESVACLCSRVLKGPTLSGAAAPGGQLPLSCSSTSSCSHLRHRRLLRPGGPILSVVGTQS